MTRMTMVEAIRDAHSVAMERDERVLVFGQDVGYFGGVFRCTQGLQQRFGTLRSEHTAPESMFDDVYSTMPPHLLRQREQAAL